MKAVKLCLYTKRDGTPCRGIAMKRRGYCRHHLEQTKRVARLARRWSLDPGPPGTLSEPFRRWLKWFNCQTLDR